MKVGLINLFVLLSFLFSCTDTNSNRQVSTTIDTSKLFDAEVGNQLNDTINQHYANVVDVINRNDSTFIDADYIQYLLGEKAIEAARKANEVDTIRNPDGTIEFAVPNDYFIVNENTKVRRISIATNCQFDLILNPDRTHKISDNKLADFRKIYKDSPFILTLNQKGQITKIKEVFLP